MIEILDGPGAGAVLPVRSAPHFLRVVIDQAGKVDALDQPDDVPLAGETIYVYVVDPATVSVVYIRPGGRYAMGRYRYLPLDAQLFDSGSVETFDVPGFADREMWVAWVREYGNTCAEKAGLAPWVERPS